MEKVLIWGRSAYFGKWRISHLRYSLNCIDSSIKIGLFVFNYRKNFSGLKNVSSIFSGFFVCKIEKTFPHS